MTALIFSNENLNHIITIIKSLEDSGFLIKGVNETIENEVKEKKRGFLGMLVATLDASLLGNILAGKGLIKAREETIKAGEGTITAGQDFQYHLIFLLTLKHKNIIKMNQNLTAFIQEIIHLK